MRAFDGKTLLENWHGLGLKAVQLRLLRELVHRRSITHRGQPLLGHLGIEEALIRADQCAVIGCGLGRLVVLRLIEASAPVKSRHRFCSAGIEPDLLVEQPRRIGV